MSGAPFSSGSAVGAAGRGREKRRFPRFDIEIPAIVRKKTGDVQLVTGDVSRHGAFLRTEHPAPIRQLVQVRFRLPEIGDIDAMCMVARWLGPDVPRGPGMGVDFFALSKEAKLMWERFVGDLRARDAAIGFDSFHTGPPGMALPPGVGLPLLRTMEPPAPTVIGPNGVPDWMAPNSVTGEIKVRGVPGLPGQGPIAQGPPPPSAIASPTLPPQLAPRAPPPPPPPEDDSPVVSDGSVVILRHTDQDHLQGFINNEVERGGMFLKTTLTKEIGEKIDVVLVHPESDEEFRLDGTVVRRVINGPAEGRGLGLFFKPLSTEAHEQLKQFVESGIEVVELGTPIAVRQLELEAAVAKEPDSAEALEALGSYLLDEEGDLGGALTALTRALVLGPSQLSIHASLARAYRRIGDPVKVRSHERVAAALMMFQDKLKVRMGVGDE